MNLRITRPAHNKGFTLIELIIVSSVTILLVSLSLTTYFSVSERQTLEKDVDYAIALIEKARLQTVNSKNNSKYSIRFASSSMTLYPGTTFSTTSSDSSIFTFSNKVEIASIYLTGNTKDISFEMITGKSNATGTIIFRLKNNQAASSTMRLYKTGLVETI